jgi:hypothetical protein
VSCKCDNPPPARQLEPGTLGQLGDPFGSVDTRQTSASKPQSQKQCISIILRSILAQSKGEFLVPLFAKIPGFNFTEWLAPNYTLVLALNIQSTLSSCTWTGLPRFLQAHHHKNLLLLRQIFLTFSARDEFNIAFSS